MGTKIRIPGLNIQHPWSKRILDQLKKIETRNYPIPQKYLGVPMAIIETPGKLGRSSNIKTKIIGIVIFSHCYKYRSKSHWAKEKNLHLIGTNDLEYFYNDNKWAWVIDRAYYVSPQNPPKVRGIRFAKECKISL